jgi:hypothetical protein
MKKHLLMLTAILSAGQLLHAQALSSKTGLRLYEHHSPLVSGSAGANGVQSAYNFVGHTYFDSFNPATFGPYTAGEHMNIDMAEHNGPYGNGGRFGFTSEVSSIWNGDIKGNGTTLWMAAPAGFNYATITDVSNISSAYNAANASKSITEVKENTVYLGRIRNTSLYVAMRCFNVKNTVAGNPNVYFDFEYKYGTLSATGVSNLGNNNVLSVYPNPAVENVVLENTLNQPLTVKIVSVNGQDIQSFSLNENGMKVVNVSDLSSGMYFVICTSRDGKRYMQKFTKQ